MRIVSDEEFNQALDNIDNKKLIKSYCNKYTSTFTPEELNSIGCMALWRCLVTHQEGRQKFTTSLYNHLKWQFLTELKEKQKDERYVNEGNFDQLVAPSGANWSELTEKLKPNEERVVSDHYLRNYNLREISKKEEISRETTRKLLRKGLDKIKRDAD